MTLLEEAIASGQVSADQIEAHRAAGDLPIEPDGTEEALDAIVGVASFLRINLEGAVTYISAADVYKPPTLRDIIDGATDESMHVWCKVADLRKALDTPESLTRKIRELVEVQGSHGNWNYDAYMQGMFNGMELTLALLEDREPQFRGKPESGWIADYAAIKATS